MSLSAQFHPSASRHVHNLAPPDNSYGRAQLVPCSDGPDCDRTASTTAGLVAFLRTRNCRLTGPHHDDSITLRIIACGLGLSQERCNWPYGPVGQKGS